MSKPVNSIEVTAMRAVIGQKVMVISNSPPYVSEGVLQSFQAVSQAESLIPLVEFSNGDVMLCLGVVLPYDEQVFKMFSEKGPEAFNWWRQAVFFREKLHRLSRREDWVGKRDPDFDCAGARQFYFRRACRVRNGWTLLVQDLQA